MKRKSNNASRDNDADLQVPRFTRAEMRRGALGKYAGRGHRFIELELDVAAEFADAAEVNEALRLVKQLRQVGKRQAKKKSA